MRTKSDSSIRGHRQDRSQFQFRDQRNQQSTTFTILFDSFDMHETDAVASRDELFAYHDISISFIFIQILFLTGYILSCRVVFTVFFNDVDCRGSLVLL